MEKVRRIELQARRMSTATFAGQYRSGFRGQGLDFDDFREYRAGDAPPLCAPFTRSASRCCYWQWT